MPIVVASSFADPKDIAAYNKAIAEGKTPAEARKVGDDGIGKWGDDTARTDVSICALPPEDWVPKSGKPLQRTREKSGGHVQGKDRHWGT
jgi:hypothetical protein